MAKQQEVNVEDLKSRGLTCSKLRKMEQDQFKNAEQFRRVGFSNIANSSEANAKKIKGLRQKVCLLK